MKRFTSCATILVALAATFISTSCTNGDPSTGGIFWSENRAQDRLAERQNKLERLEGQTRSSNRKAASTQQRIDDLR